MLNLPLANIIDNLQAAGNQTGWNSKQFIAQCVWILVLFLVLNQFAWKLVRTMLEERRNAIEKSMADVERVKKEVAETEASRLAVLSKANEQANRIIADAEKSAAVRTEQRTQEATRQAEEIVKKAHEAAVLDRDRLLAELKQQVGLLVVQTTGKVAGKVLTPADQTRLNEETTRHLSASNN
jgi:F-type H+-transporting ATPase subunit b